MAELRFRYGTEGADPARCLVVDGIADGFRSLSHWPGHGTPPALRHDLSTGIALAWARCSPAERLTLAGPFDEVANTHFDTDGVLSVFSVMRPDEALARAELLLAAAATGDFATWNGEHALAVELSIMALPSHPDSPLARALPADASDALRWERAYLWAIEHLPALLDDPWRYRPLWQPRFEQVSADIAALEADEADLGLELQTDAELDLAVVRTARPLSSIALHHAAGPRYRVLAVLRGEDGPRYRFCYRDESWFDLVSIHAAPRLPLDAAVAELQRREQRAGGQARWWCDELSTPVVQLGHCDPAEARAAGFFLDPLDQPGPPSRLATEEVLDVLREALSEGC
ncbi:MAG: hypothetical protein DRQ55_11490 [Planctomycetota bacterium]|nr:MAG: hypothetical protein DRQ55_11490 [Planctomycetota bacterium]